MHAGEKALIKNPGFETKRLRCACASGEPLLESSDVAVSCDFPPYAENLFGRRFLLPTDLKGKTGLDA